MERDLPCLWITTLKRLIDPPMPTQQDLMRYQEKSKSSIILLVATTQITKYS